ncbi:hypothetical protein BJX76DRAFT_116955 [Aspergillus varians]
MDTNDQLLVSEPTCSTAIPIAQLSPDVDRLQQSSIHSVVTLLWPYSSSTKTLSLLLAEPDFRLRRSNGQVKVFFHGHVAEEVARSQLGIGDNVYLGLAGSRLVKNDAVAQTPGKGVSWDVHFDTSAFLEVWRDSKPLKIVKVERSSFTPPPADKTAVAPSTPAANGATYAPGHIGSTSWHSPAFLGKSRASFGYTDPAIDPFVEEDGFVPGKGRKRPRFSMRNSEWRVIDEPDSPRDRDSPEDWMAMFDEEELTSGSDAGEKTLAQDTEGSAVPSSLQVLTEPASAVDTDVPMVDVRPDTLAPAANQPADIANDDVQFLHPNIASRSVSESTKLPGPDHAFHLPTDTPRLHPIPSPGLPAPSPLPTNTQSEYFMPVTNTAPATPSIIPAVTVSKEIPGLDNSATHPQVTPDGEPTHTDEDDAMTVYTDDVQVLPDSVPNSGEATSSPQPPDSRVATSGIVEEEELDEAAEKLTYIDVESAEAVAPKAPIEGSGLELGEELEGEEDEGSERLDSPSLEPEEDRTSVERLPERLDQEPEDESDGISAAWSETEEVDADVGGIRKQEEPHAVRRESLSSGESRDMSDEPGDLYGSHEEDVIEGSDQGEYENDYGDDEQDDRARGEYDYSESEAESDYEEEPPSRFTPKIVEPEVIVLDSDSEEESSAQRPTDAANREAEDFSDEDSYDSESQSHWPEDVYADPQPGKDMIEEDQDDEDDYGPGAEYEMDKEPEGAEVDREDDQSLEEEGPVDGWRSEPNRMDEDVHDEGLAEDYDREVQKQPNMEMEATIAEPPLEPDQSPAPNEVPVLHEYFEDFQTVTEYTHGINHDSLDYLATISESVERLHAASESTQPSYDMAIDPSLYELGAPQDNTMTGTDEQDYPRELPVEKNDESAMESPSSIPERHLSLQLDGAAPPESVVESIEETVFMPLGHENGQLSTPGPSQLVDADQAPNPIAIEISGEMLSTPALTQEVLSKPETEQPPQTPTEARVFGVSENGSPSLNAAVESENGPDVPEGKESEPAPPMIAVDAVKPTLQDEDQQLQASIEVDDQSEGAFDDTDYVSVNRYFLGLRSKLSYFAPLATLIDHYNALVDTISIASGVGPPTKAASGKKDFILNLQLTDPSMAGTTIFAQILRPHKPALPNPQEGDALLLRNFRVKTFDHSIILVSESTSAWAVFSPSSEDPEIAGPPVEYGAEEKTFATDLRQWYLENGLAMVADNQLQASVGRESRAETPASSAAPSDAGSLEWALREARGDTSSNRGSRRRKSHRRITIHELRDGRRYTEVGSSPGDGSIHELRDGTVYANL